MIWVFVPIAPPIMNAISANANHPQMAFFRCCALQRPTRAASVVVTVRWTVMLDPPVRDISDIAQTLSGRPAGPEGKAGVPEVRTDAGRGSVCHPGVRPAV